uniref:Uncharacterized protein n=1 Tax=Meloidogyne enterolobii TaxID=390850 RepID=A0A6V7UDR0_MELEN|nr:unnamed protein product [Meloidogyne enterolobii]
MLQATPILLIWQAEEKMTSTPFKIIKCTGMALYGCCPTNGLHINSFLKGKNSCMPKSKNKTQNIH